VQKWKKNLSKIRKDAAFEENNKVWKVKAYPKERKMAIMRPIYKNNEKLGLA